MRKEREMDIECPRCHEKNLVCLMMSHPDCISEGVGIWQFWVMCRTTTCGFSKTCGPVPYSSDVCHGKDEEAALFEMASEAMRRNYGGKQ